MTSIYIRKIQSLKSKDDYYIHVCNLQSHKYKLRALTYKDLANRSVISKLSVWRAKSSYWFGSTFDISDDRTKSWLKKFVLDKEDRILFVVEDDDGKLYGHLGFNRFSKNDTTCELDNVVRGVDEVPGLMTLCVKRLIKWGLRNLRLKNINLTTFADNQRAISLYRRCHFKIIDKTPLVRRKVNGELTWIEKKGKEKFRAKRYYVRMKYTGK